MCQLDRSGSIQTMTWEMMISIDGLEGWKVYPVFVRLESSITFPLDQSPSAWSILLWSIAILMTTLRVLPNAGNTAPIELPKQNLNLPGQSN